MRPESSYTDRPILWVR